MNIFLVQIQENLEYVCILSMSQKVTIRDQGRGLVTSHPVNFTFLLTKKEAEVAGLFM